MKIESCNDVVMRCLCIRATRKLTQKFSQPEVTAALAPASCSSAIKLMFTQFTDAAASPAAAVGSLPPLDAAALHCA